MIGWFACQESNCMQASKREEKTKRERSKSRDDLLLILVLVCTPYSTFSPNNGRE